MTTSKLVGLLYGAWGDLDRALEGLTDEEALKRHDGGSAFAWTLGHLTGNIDFIVNVRIRNRSMHPTLEKAFNDHGTSGDAENWQAMQASVREVRAELRTYLDSLSDDDLERIRFPATGDWPETSLRYVIYRFIAHHYYHIGEIASTRSRYGHAAGDYPGALSDAL